ncbi:MAG: hypothetical protein SF029_11035 [bacterium]|nr:hypothetical protein [bacterium]
MVMFTLEMLKQLQQRACEVMETNEYEFLQLCHAVGLLADLHAGRLELVATVGTEQRQLPVHTLSDLHQMVEQYGFGEVYAVPKGKTYFPGAPIVGDFDPNGAQTGYILGLVLPRQPVNGREGAAFNFPNQLQSALTRFDASNPNWKNHLNALLDPFEDEDGDSD